MNKTRRRALRLALYFDVIHIRPQIIGDSYKEYVEAFEQQYRALPESLRNTARIKAHKLIKDDGLEISAAHLVPAVRTPPTTGKMQTTKWKYRRMMQFWPPETPPCPQCRILGCLPKRSWPSKEQAEAVRSHQNEPKLEVYSCPVQPGYWHLGHRRRL